MEEIIDLTPWVSQKYPKPKEKEQRALILFLISLPERKDADILEKGISLYAPFLSLCFNSLSVSPFDEKGTIEELSLKAVQSFVLYTVEPVKALASLLLSFRYFLTAICVDNA